MKVDLIYDKILTEMYLGVGLAFLVVVMIGGSVGSSLGKPSWLMLSSFPAMKMKFFDENDENDDYIYKGRFTM